MFDFRRIIVFCLEKRISKHKMTIFSTNLGGMASLPPHGYAYGAVHEEVDGLDIGGQHGRRFVLLRHTHRPQRR